MTLSFTNVVNIFKLKNKATSDTNIKEVPKGLELKTTIYTRESKCTTNYGTLNFHPSRGTRWVSYIHEYCFDSYGTRTPNLLTKNNFKRIGEGVFFYNKMRGKDSYCAVYCLYTIHSTKKLKKTKSSALRLYIKKDERKTMIDNSVNNAHSVNGLQNEHTSIDEKNNTNKEKLLETRITTEPKRKHERKTNKKHGSKRHAPTPRDADGSLTKQNKYFLKCLVKDLELLNEHKKTDERLNIIENSTGLLKNQTKQDGRNL